MRRANLLLVAMLGCQPRTASHATPPQPIAVAPTPDAATASDFGEPCTTDVEQSIEGPKLPAGRTELVICRIDDAGHDRRAVMRLHRRDGGTTSIQITDWTIDPALPMTWQVIGLLHGPQGADALLIERTAPEGPEPWSRRDELLGASYDPGDGWMIHEVVERANGIGAIVDPDAKVAHVTTCEWDREGSMGCAISAEFDLIFDGSDFDRRPTVH